MDADSFLDTQTDGLVATDVNEIIQAVVHQTQSYLLARNTHITTELGCTPPLRGDHQRLADVLCSLVLRSERSIGAAGCPVGAIRIRTWFARNFICCNVSDNGLDCRSVGKLTSDPFLNLTACSEIIFDHGGWMYCWHPYVGGASYTIMLPAALD